MYKNFIIKETPKTFEDFLKEGLTFKEINTKIMKGEKNSKTFEDFLKGLPTLHCMFVEWLEDEASGLIDNIESLGTAFDNYFNMSWGWYLKELQENGGDLTEDDINEDAEAIYNYMCNFDSELYDKLGL